MPRDGATQNGLGPPTSIILKIICHRHATGQFDLGNLSIEVPSSQMTLGLSI